MTTSTFRLGIAVQRIQILSYFSARPGEEVRVRPAANGFSISAKDDCGRWFQSSEIYSVDEIEEMIDFTMSQTAKDLWGAFLTDMTAFVTKFFDFVDTGNNAAARLILKVWLLGYEEGCNLDSEDRWALEELLEKYLVETVDES